MGKSALADQLEWLAAAESYQTHHGKALDFGEGAGPGPIGMVVRSLIDAPANAHDDAAADARISGRSRGVERRVVLRFFFYSGRSYEKRWLQGFWDYTQTL